MISIWGVEGTEVQREEFLIQGRRVREGAEVPIRGDLPAGRPER